MKTTTFANARMYPGVWSRSRKFRPPLRDAGTARFMPFSTPTPPPLSWAPSPPEAPRSARQGKPREEPQPPLSMSIKSDRWIRRMAEEEGMIEPFEPGQVKDGTNGGVLQDPKGHPGDLRGEEHLRPVRHHRECDPSGAHLGRASHPGDIQHHAPSGQGVCRRGGLFLGRGPGRYAPGGMGQNGGEGETSHFWGRVLSAAPPPAQRGRGSPPQETSTTSTSKTNVELGGILQLPPAP